MPDLLSSGVKLAGLSAAVPQNREDNSKLDSLSDQNKKEIINQVGIRYRHVVPDGVTAADLCGKAASKLLDDLGWDPKEIGLLVFVSQTPDHLVPGSATQLQQRLGLREDALVLDVNQGCAGYVYGLSTISGLMSAYSISKALLLVGDTITNMISENDNSLKPIFADAGSATALILDDNATDMMFKVGSKGDAFKAIHIPEGGARNPKTEERQSTPTGTTSATRRPDQLHMNGQAVFTFGLSTVASSITDILEENSRGPEAVDFLVLHQANQLLNDSIVRKVGIPKEKAPSSLKNFGNTSCATIPVTLVSQLRKELRSGKRNLLLTGFGVGLSWGSVLLTTDSIVCPKMIYV